MKKLLAMLCCLFVAIVFLTPTIAKAEQKRIYQWPPEGGAFYAKQGWIIRGNHLIADPMCPPETLKYYDNNDKTEFIVVYDEGNWIYPNDNEGKNLNIYIGYSELEVMDHMARVHRGYIRDRGLSHWPYSPQPEPEGPPRQEYRVRRLPKGVAVYIDIDCNTNVLTGGRVRTQDCNGGYTKKLWTQNCNNPSIVKYTISCWIMAEDDNSYIFENVVNCPPSQDLHVFVRKKYHELSGIAENTMDGYNWDGTYLESVGW